MRVAGALLFYVLAAVVIALSLPLAALVLALTFPVDRQRRLTSSVLRLLGALLASTPFWRVTVEGELPAPPATFVVVPNHTSMVDALAVARLPRDLKWLGKIEAFRLPWLGWAFRLAGYVPVDRGDRASGAAALARLRRYLDAGVPVGLFPEGTRSRDGTLRDFRAGPFRLALEAGVPVVPVAISGAGAAMAPGHAWIRPSRIRVRILPPQRTAGRPPSDVDALREATRAAIAAALAAPPSPPRSGGEGRGEGAPSPPP